MGNDNTHPT